MSIENIRVYYYLVRYLYFLYCDYSLNGYFIEHSNTLKFTSYKKKLRYAFSILIVLIKY